MQFGTNFSCVEVCIASPYLVSYVLHEYVMSEKTFPLVQLGHNKRGMNQLFLFNLHLCQTTMY